MKPGCKDQISIILQSPHKRIEADLVLAQRDQLVKEHGFDAFEHHE
jgi:hypothetical protein